MRKVDEHRIQNIKFGYEDCGDIPVWKALVLVDMAARDIYPDGTFSDDDTVLWCWFRRLMRQKKNEVPVIM